MGVSVAYRQTRRKEEKSGEKTCPVSETNISLAKIMKGKNNKIFEQFQIVRAQWSIWYPKKEDGCTYR